MVFLMQTNLLSKIVFCLLTSKKFAATTLPIILFYLASQIHGIEQNDIPTNSFGVLSNNI